jgi:hypothetical protein
MEQRLWREGVRLCVWQARCLQTTASSTPGPMTQVRAGRHAQSAVVCVQDKIRAQNIHTHAKGACPCLCPGVTGSMLLLLVN